MTDISHLAALDYLCNAAQRVIPLSDVNSYNAAHRALYELITDHAARQKIAADRAEK